MSFSLMPLSCRMHFKANPHQTHIALKLPIICLALIAQLVKVLDLYCSSPCLTWVQILPGANVFDDINFNTSSLDKYHWKL